MFLFHQVRSSTGVVAELVTQKSQDLATRVLGGVKSQTDTRRAVTVEAVVRKPKARLGNQAMFKAGRVTGEEAQIRPASSLGRAVLLRPLHDMDGLVGDGGTPSHGRPRSAARTYQLPPMYVDMDLVWWGRVGKVFHRGEEHRVASSPGIR